MTNYLFLLFKEGVGGGDVVCSLAVRIYIFVFFLNVYFLEFKLK